jgi:hypothetical protein
MQDDTQILLASEPQPHEPLFGECKSDFVLRVSRAGEIGFYAAAELYDAYIRPITRTPTFDEQERDAALVAHQELLDEERFAAGRAILQASNDIKEW